MQYKKLGQHIFSLKNMQTHSVTMRGSLIFCWFYFWGGELYRKGLFGPVPPPVWPPEPAKNRLREVKIARWWSVLFAFGGGGLYIGGTAGGGLAPAGRGGSPFLWLSSHRRRVVTPAFVTFVTFPAFPFRLLPRKHTPSPLFSLGNFIICIMENSFSLFFNDLTTSLLVGWEKTLIYQGLA